MDPTQAAGGVNVLAVVAAAVATFVLGGIWYGPLFGRTWMRQSGVTEEQARSGSKAVIFGGSLVLQLVAAASLAMFIGPSASFGFAVFAGGAAGLTWVATALGVTYLFERRPLGHWAVNAGYQVLAFLLMGAILGAWR